MSAGTGEVGQGWQRASKLEECCLAAAAGGTCTPAAPCRAGEHLSLSPRALSCSLPCCQGCVHRWLLGRQVVGTAGRCGAMGTQQRGSPGQGSCAAAVLWPRAGQKRKEQRGNSALLCTSGSSDHTAAQLCFLHLLHLALPRSPGLLCSDGQNAAWPAVRLLPADGMSPASSQPNAEEVL